MERACRVGQFEVSSRTDAPLLVIAGPCLFESQELGLRIAERMQTACDQAGASFVFKASFDKANRSSVDSARGPGLDDALAWFATVKDRLGCPATTDVHDPAQCAPVAEVVDVLQIPAFLSRQTDLVMAAGEAAAARGRCVNVKKGQFMSPAEMRGPLGKLEEAGCDQAMLTERGTFFGYGRLVNDFLGVRAMMDLGPIAGQHGAPVCFDCTHSTQRPGGKTTDGAGEGTARALARAACAIGVDALFLECHPDPATAMSDAATMVTIDEAERIIRECAQIRAL